MAGVSGKWMLILVNDWLFWKKDVISDKWPLFLVNGLYFW